MADHWALPPDEFEFDLEAEDQEVRDQLDRIEEKLDEILREIKGEDDEGGGDLPPEPPGPLHPPSAPSEVEPETPKEARQQQDE